jgi:hypothetical protein
MHRILRYAMLFSHKLKSNKKKATIKAVMISNEHQLREKYVAALTLSAESERKETVSPNSDDQRWRRKNTPSVSKLRNVISEKTTVSSWSLELSLKGGWEKTTQRKQMVALEQSFKHENKGNFLATAQKSQKGIHEYKCSRMIEEKILGKDHPVVVALRSEIAGTAIKESKSRITAERTTVQVAFMPYSKNGAESPQSSAEPLSVNKVKRTSSIASIPPPTFHQHTLLPMSA